MLCLSLKKAKVHDLLFMYKINQLPVQHFGSLWCWSLQSFSISSSKIITWGLNHWSEYVIFPNRFKSLLREIRGTFIDSIHHRHFDWLPSGGRKTKYAIAQIWYYILVVNVIRINLHWSNWWIAVMMYISVHIVSEVACLAQEILCFKSSQNIFVPL